MWSVDGNRRVIVCDCPHAMIVRPVDACEALHVRSIMCGSEERVEGESTRCVEREQHARFHRDSRERVSGRALALSTARVNGRSCGKHPKLEQRVVALPKASYTGSRLSLRGGGAVPTLGGCCSAR